MAELIELDSIAAYINTNPFQIKPKPFCSTLTLAQSFADTPEHP